MRIALITPGFSASEEDWCIPALLTLVRQLTRHHAVEIFSLRYPPTRATYSVYGATVHAFGGGLARGVSRLPLLGQALLHMVRRHRRHPFDVIHGLWADEPGYLAVAAGRLLAVPAVVSLMGGELVGLRDIGYGAQLSRAGRYMIRHALRGADRVTAGSTYLGTMAGPVVDAPRLMLVPLGVDGDLFAPDARRAERAPLVEGDVKLLHVASLVPVKDQATILRSLGTVVRHRPDVHLHIVGGGQLHATLVELARAEGIAAHVSFHGAVAHDHLPAYYRAADLCVLGSRFESQSLAALEAAACGRATIGTRVGIIPDLYPEAWTVATRDHVTLADTLLKAVGTADCLAELGRISIEAVRERYSLERTLADLQAVYMSLAPHSQT